MLICYNNAMIWHWLVHLTGVDDTTGTAYSFWSGIGSDIGEIVLIGSLYTILRAHNCHVKGCWRVGKHAVGGTPYKVCRRHHPDMPAEITPEHVASKYEAGKHLR